MTVKTPTLFAAGAIATCLLFSGGAQAAELVNGAYYGSGNNYAPGNWTVATVNGYELGLRGHVFQQAATAPTGNVYVVPLNNVASLDFSFDNLVLNRSLVGLTSVLKITNAAGGSAMYNALLTPDNAQNPNGNGGEQNSLRLSFGFVNGAISFNVGDINYDSTVNSTYNVAFSVMDSNLNTLASNSIVIRQGSGLAVPEPGTWALMIVGFGSVGAMMRRRRLLPA